MTSWRSTRIVVLVMALLGLTFLNGPAALAGKPGPSTSGGINLKIQGFDKLSKSWTPGNTGGYAETESIPFRVILTGPGTLKSLTVLADHLRDGVKGIEDLNSFQVCTGAPVTGPEGATGCSAITQSGLTVTRDLPNPVVSGVEQISYTFRNIQIPSSGLVLKWGAELAIGSHLYNGSALHMAIGSATATDGSAVSFGSKDVPIPVNAILATETDKKIDGRDEIKADNPLVEGSTYDVTIASKAVGPAKGTQTLTITDELPDCLTYADTAKLTLGSTTSSITPSVQPAKDGGGNYLPGGTVSFVVPNVKNGSVATIAFKVVAGKVGTCTNVARTTSDKTVVPSTDTVPIATVGHPDMAVTKDCTDFVAPGTTATCTISYENTGNAVAKDVTLTDDLDPRLVYVAVAGELQPVDATANPLVWKLGDLQPGDKGTITYKERVPATGPAGTEEFKDTATSHTTGDSDPGDDSDTEIVKVIYAADLAISKACPATMPVNTPTEESVTYQNKGTAAATGVTIVDTLPAGMSYVAGSASVAPTSVVGGVITWEIGNVAAQSAPVKITYKVTVSAGGTFKNVATIDSDQADADTSDNKAECTAGATFTDVGIDKACPSTADPGAIVTHTLTFSNTGNVAASGVKIVDTLDAGLTYRTGSAKLNGTTSITPAVNGQELTFTLDTLAAGATGTITYEVKIDDTASSAGIKTFTDTAKISTTSTDAVNPTNDAKACQTKVDYQPRLDVTKAGCRTTVVPGGYQTYTLSFENTGSAPATGAKLTDKPPADQPIAEAPGAQAPISNNTAVWDLGTLDPGEKGTRTLTVLVNASDGSVVSNTAQLTATNASADSSTEFTTVSAAGAVTDGSAYALYAQVGGTALTPQQAKSSTSAPSGVGDDQAGPVVPIDVGGLVNAGVLSSASHSQREIGSTSSMSSSTVAGLKLLGGLVQAKEVHAVSTSVAGPFGASSSSEGSTFTDLVIGGNKIAQPVTPGTVIKVPYLLGTATVTLLSPDRSADLVNGKYVTSGSVDMIKVSISGVLGLVDGTEIVVAHAQSSATYPAGNACGTNPNTVSGRAFTAFAATPLVEPVYVNKAEISPLGGNASADAASVTGLTGVLGASALTNSASGTNLDPPASTGHSHAASVNVLNGLVTADALDVKADSTANGTTAGTTFTTDFVNLRVGGTPVPLPVQPNTTIDVPSGGGIAHVVLNEQATNTPAGGDDTEGTVNAIHVLLFDAVGILKSEVIVVSAHSDAHRG